MSQSVDCGTPIINPHHWRIEPSDASTAPTMLGFCIKCGAMRTFSRKMKMKYPSQQETRLIRKVMEMENWLDSVAPRYTDAEERVLHRRRQAAEYSLRRRAASR